MIPGISVWGTFVFIIILSIFQPIWAIYFIIVFDLYWLVRISYLLSFTFMGYLRFKKDVRVDWLTRCKSLIIWEEMYHLIFIPTFQEPLEVLHEVLEGICKSNYPLKKFIVVLGGEEADKGNFSSYARSLVGEYHGKFSEMLVTVHPAHLVGEIPGKGSNLAWAGRQAQNFIDSKNIPYEHVIVTSLDADTVVHPQYFSYLTYRYLTHPAPTRTSFQPIPLFNNNVWETHAFSRVISYSTTFWLMAEQLRPERLSTFSSHSMSFTALVDVGFWQSDIVTEDSRIGLQGIMHYDGEYQIEPMYIPLSMDIVSGKTIWQTIKSQYKQQRRWAYGIENFPWMVWNFGSNKQIPFMKKFRYIFNQLEGVYSWATAPIVIFIVGRLPLWMANRGIDLPAVTQNVPLILKWLMTASTIGILLSAILGATLLPPRPRNATKWKYLMMVLQWAFLPFTLILFGSVPATDAVTRLMLGKYLGFEVTKKMRKNSAVPGEG